MPRYNHRSPISTSPFFSRNHTMPSPRRVKVLTLLVFLSVVIILFYTSSMRQQHSLSMSDPFYEKTMAGLKDKDATAGKASTNSEDKKEDAKGDDEEVTRLMTERLKEAAKSAKDKANAKAPKPDPPSKVVGVGSAAEGADKSASKKKVAAEEQEVIKEEETEETKEEHEVEVELNSILKKAPVIIFSKSYCPYSRRAKGVLLEKYIIDPVPFVVELDQHPLGPKLQAKLADLTNRKTVPNILVNGLSIGGGDEIGELDTNKKLIDKIKELAGKKIVAMSLRDVEAEHGL